MENSFAVRYGLLLFQDVPLIFYDRQGMKSIQGSCLRQADIRRPALIPPDPVDMALKLPAADQFRQHILLKGRYGAAVKADAQFKDREKRPG